MSGTKRSVDTSSEADNGPKRMRTGEPEVTIIVGGETTFHHYIQLLCNTSDYFDAMLSSDMKESQTKVVEFKDKDPNDWKELSVFFDDPHMAEVNLENVDTLVPLFSELRMMGSLHRSDKFLKEEILKIEAEFKKTTSETWFDKPRLCTRRVVDNKMGQVMRLVSSIVAHLKMSIDHHLVLSKEKGLLFLGEVLDDTPHLLQHGDSIGTVASFFNDTQAKNRLWPILKKKLPEACQSLSTDSLSGCALLEAVIQLKAELSQASWQSYRRDVS